MITVEVTARMGEKVEGIGSPLVVETALSDVRGQLRLSPDTMRWYGLCSGPFISDQRMELARIIRSSPVFRIGGKWKVKVYHDHCKVFPLEGDASSPSAVRIYFRRKDAAKATTA